MRRTALAAGLAIALLGAGALAVISRVTRGAPRARAHPGALQVVAPPAGAPAGAVARPPEAAGSQELAGPGSSVAAGAGFYGKPPATSARAHSRAERRLLRAQQVRQKLAARRSDALPPGPQAGAHGLPPEERAAMEAAGLDWRKVERMLRGAAAHDEGAAPGEEAR